MLRLLWLIPTLPLLGFVVLVLLGARLGRKAVSVIAVGSVAASTLVTAAVAIAFLARTPAGDSYSQTLWRWFQAGHFTTNVAFYLDALSLTMVSVVTFVGLLILDKADSESEWRLPPCQNVQFM